MFVAAAVNVVVDDVADGIASASTFFFIETENERYFIAGHRFRSTRQLGVRSSGRQRAKCTQRILWNLHCAWLRAMIKNKSCVFIRNIGACINTFVTSIFDIRPNCITCSPFAGPLTLFGRLPGAHNSYAALHTLRPANLFNFKLNKSRTKVSRLWTMNANVRTIN